MGMQYQKEKRTRQENRFVMEHPEFVEDLIQKLPYELTGAQRRALHDVTENMQGPYAMQRLIQGDVGSGKTILAFLAMACAHRMDISLPSWHRRKYLHSSIMKHSRNSVSSLDCIFR